MSRHFFRRGAGILFLLGIIIGLGFLTLQGAPPVLFVREAEKIFAPGAVIDTQLQFSPEGALIVVRLSDGLMFLDAATLEERSTFLLPAELRSSAWKCFGGVVFLGERKEVIASVGGGSWTSPEEGSFLVRWDLPTRTVKSVKKLFPDNDCPQLAPLSGGRYLGAWTRTGRRIAIVDVSSGQKAAEIGAEQAAAGGGVESRTEVIPASDWSFVLIVTSEGRAYTLRLPLLEPGQQFEGMVLPPHTLSTEFALGPGGRHMAAIAESPGTTRLTLYENGKVSEQLSIAHSVSRLSFTPEGGTLLFTQIIAGPAGHRNRIMKMPAKGGAIDSLSDACSALRPIVRGRELFCQSPEQGLFYGVGGWAIESLQALAGLLRLDLRADAAVYVYDLDSGALRGQAQIEGTKAMAYTVSPDAGALAVFEDENRLTLWRRKQTPASVREK